MSTPQPYNRFSPAKNFDTIDFLPDRWHQSAEMNEVQSIFAHRLRGLADALFTDGAIVRDARCIVDTTTGQAELQAGALYIKGAVRAVAAALLTVPLSGTVSVGVYARAEVITELQDPTLRNPAVGTLGYQQPGAWRTRVSLQWGLPGDGTEGDYTPIWEIVDGVVRQREAAPQLGAITQAIERYDRDSSGGTYVVIGLETSALPDSNGEQVYSLSRGSARVNGRAVESPVNRRIEIATTPDLALVDAEPKVSTGEALQHITFDRYPVDIDSVKVRILRRRTVDIVHGGFVGAADPLPDNAVLVIESIKQGATTYAASTDYQFAANQIDWSPAGTEPAPGSTYRVTYQYKTLETPGNLTAYGYDITGAIAGTLIESTYQHKLRRIDSIVMDEQGDLRLVRGVPDTWSPRPPALPASMLGLANIHQRWDEGRRIELSAVRVVPMSELVDYDTRLDNVARQLAELRLAVSIAGRYSGIKHGQFADPMQDDSQRDAGIQQTAVISQGWLQLPGGIDSSPMAPLSAPVAMPHTPVAALRQALRTGSLAINPTTKPSPRRPTTLTLTPAVDLWHAGELVFNMAWLNYEESLKYRTAEQKEQRVVDEARKALLLRKKPDGPEPTMRKIAITLDITGFVAGEAVGGIVIGGVPVAHSAHNGAATVAAADGTLSVRTTIPEGVPYGTTAITVTGAAGSTATAYYRAAITYDAVSTYVDNSHPASSLYGFAVYRVRFEA